ncbi:hypothetical protein J1614_009616 [Plenodomus biglobosus]|nr:hypothetical protein J1614_009616 [Plenodomus biglobosus]
MSKLLTEQSVPFPGDDVGFKLNWLGQAPFMQAQVARASMNPATNRRNKTDNDDKSEALVLHVQLSSKTFASGLDRTKTSIKLDVLFNGELTSSFFMPLHDVRSGTKSLHQVFAGTRVDYLSERPWIIERTGLTADISGEDQPVATSVEPRWQAICQALQHEAQARGTNVQGNIPPSAEFLRALAAMQMPRQVHDMQRPGGRNFGVIDVIICAGEGKKTTAGAGYLKAPQRLIDDNFTLNAVSTDGGNQILNASLGASSSIAPDPMSYIMGAAGNCESDGEPDAKRRALTPRVLSLDKASAASHPFLGLGPLSDPSARSLVTSPLSVAKTKYNQDPPPPIVQNQGHFQHHVLPEHYYTDDEAPNSHLQGQGQYGTLLEVRSHGIQPWHNILMLRQPPHPISEGLIPFLGGYQSSPVPNLGPNLRRPFHLLSSSPSTSIRQNAMRLGDSVPNDFDPFRSHDFQLPYRRENRNVAPVAPMYPWAMPTRPSPHTPNPISDYSPNFPGMSARVASNYPDTFASRPPLGAYTVPQKPKSNLGLNKTQSIEQKIQSHQSLQVTRLVIYGQSAPIIDHRWAIPQCVSRGPGGWTIENHHSAGALPGVYGKLQGRPRPNETFAFGLPSEKDMSQPGEPSSTSSPQNSGPEVRHLNIEDSLGTNQVREPMSYPSCNAVSGSRILGIQGPKATTFWLDDPEEILRESSRRRRSRSSTKRADGPVEVPHSKVACLAESSMLAESTPSSPLSSAPTTPEPMVGVVTATPMRRTQQLLQQRGPWVPQADGPSESPVVSTAIHFNTPPPWEDLPFKNPRQVTHAEATSGLANPFLNSKKRKATTQPATQMWRNHDRIIEVTDPVLNENCVIAYADMETPEASSGPLRQVKSERQGVFQEQYVIFAARFFVPGN